MRSKFDENEVVILPSCAEIILYDKNNEEKARAIIDTDLLEQVKGVKWYLRPDGYVASSNYRGNGYAYLHTVIVGEHNPRSYIDHANGNRLDNRRHNLRRANASENGANKCIRSDNKSGRVGVHWSKANNMWCAMICYKKKHKNLGYFKNFEDAVKCRESAEAQLFQEFRPSEMRVKK